MKKYEVIPLGHCDKYQNQPDGHCDGALMVEFTNAIVAPSFCQRCFRRKEDDEIIAEWDEKIEVAQDQLEEIMQAMNHEQTEDDLMDLVLSHNKTQDRVTRLESECRSQIAYFRSLMGVFADA